MYMMDESRAHSCPAVPQDLGSGMSNSRTPCARSLKEPPPAPGPAGCAQGEKVLEAGWD